MTDRLKVLLVDDECCIRELLEGVVPSLLGRRCLFFHAGSGKEALKILRQVKIDLQLVDIAMPELDGARYLKYLNCREPQIPTVVITGLPEIPDIPNHQLIHKPFESRDLSSCIKTALKRGSHE